MEVRVEVLRRLPHEAQQQATDEAWQGDLHCAVT
jgi:hypothetical protein